MTIHMAQIVQVVGEWLHQRTLEFDQLLKQKIINPLVRALIFIIGIDY